MQKVKNPNGIGEENKIVVRQIGLTALITSIVLAVVSIVIFILRQVSLDSIPSPTVPVPTAAITPTITTTVPVP